ncbi:MAG: ferridoxin [Deltaproteobacteria bacterium HGW-Deltaproteobacteria-13]|jgi:nitroreductase/NAD-dependent dihydropyrimidine dehydrogenase PreA subunit|nr:MAG: ferridoxin [Deltaproteobacteria bacterium HGW-Deltaproteobacteria-13]
MSLFNIDQIKCKRDGICAAECPAKIIVQDDKKSFPSLIEDGEEFCINCGHCAAVCPYGALTLSTMPLSACPPIQKNILPDADALKQLLRARRSIREYKGKVVSRKLLAELIDTARYAPTASNAQQVQWTVFQNPEDVRKLAGMVVDFTKMILPVMTDVERAKRMQRLVDAWADGKDRVMRGAPHLIIVHCPADLPFTATDCAIALTYLELYAYSKGLGTCWAGYFTAAAGMHEPLIKALDLPAGHKCFGAVMVGYPKYSYHRIPLRNEPLITWR